MTKHLIAGTAGHIDHGKTTLIRALTGINTDRLKEEQERGITIELGFAHLTLPSGATLGIVDVPGHEKFVRHMVAGAAGIDMVMLVIAADEGIMPQTREHLDICRMLDIRQGLVVLTKKDMVDAEWLRMVADEVKAFTTGTFLEGAAVIPVSGTTGEGLPQLVAALETLVELVQPRPPWGIFRMPVDRVFTMKGFGTVVTGTTVSGRVAVGEPVSVYPRGLETRVRGLQVHNAAVEAAEAGFRTAVNLQGVEKDQVERGDVVGHPGQLVPSYIMDVRLHLLPSAPKPLASRARVRFHLGTSEILARVHLLEDRELAPGHQALAQIRLEKPTVALARDRFVVRSYSPSFTVGGGAVIDPAADKYFRRRKAVAAIIAKLRSLEKGSPPEAILAALQHGGPAGETLSVLSRSLNLDENTVAQLLAELTASGAVLRTGSGPQDPFLHAGVFQSLKESAVTLLEKFHRESPLKPGLSREELKTKLPRNLHPKALASLMEGLERDGLTAHVGQAVRLASYRVRLDPGQQALRDRLEEALRKAGLAVPSPAELSVQVRADLKAVTGLLEMMANEGTLVKIHEDIYLHGDALRKLTADIEAHFSANAELTVGHFKEMTSLSRKYTIPILEWFDRHGVTLRVGDKRMLKKK